MRTSTFLNTSSKIKLFLRVEFEASTNFLATDSMSACLLVPAKTYKTRKGIDVGEEAGFTEEAGWESIGAGGLLCGH